jgi:hypothetical protein
VNLTDDVQRNRLFKAVESSYRAIEPFRNLNRGLIEEYAGSGYGQMNRPRHETLINLMNQAVSAYQMVLVANRPRVLISSNRRELQIFARRFQVAINNLIAEIGLEYTLKQWVLDAFFCVGFIKVHMADAGQVMLEQNLWADPGTPYASNVSLDNWVHDMGATKWREVRFAGDCYRLSYDDVMAEAGGMFEADALEDLKPTSKYSSHDSERIAAISKGQDVDQDEFEPMVDLCDLWVPRENMIYTFAVEHLGQMRLKGGPLAAMPWNGPEFGPYHMLGFEDVPENILPTSPASHLSSLSRLANNLMRKQSRRARSAKRMHTYNSGGQDAAKRLQRASDDEWIHVEDPKEIGQVDVGGVDPQMQAYLIGVMEMFDRAAGNLTAMMGLGAQADTASQETLIHSAVSKKEANMQYRVIDGARCVIRDLGHMLWHDQFKVLSGQEQVEGLEGYTVDMTWTPQDREGDFMDYNFDIDLYSMPYQSPAQKVTALNQLLTQIYAPLANVLMQQGGSINLQALTNIYAEMLSMPRLKEVVQFAQPLPEESGPAPGMGEHDRDTPLPSQTNRTYTRKNVATGGTLASRQHIQQQAWMGGSVNPQQAASMGRAPA